MIVMIMAITPSLNASSRLLSMECLLLAARPDAPHRAGQTRRARDARPPACRTLRAPEPGALHLREPDERSCAGPSLRMARTAPFYPRMSAAVFACRQSRDDRCRDSRRR